MLSMLSLATLVLAGALFGVGPIQSHGRRAAIAWLSAIGLELMLSSVLVNTRLDAWLHGLVYGAHGAIGLPVAAALETGGLWLPVVAVPWASVRARVACGLGLYAASLIAASGFYYADDILEINGVVVSPSRIEYLVVLVVLLPIAGLGHLLVYIARRGRSASTTA